MVKKLQITLGNKTFYTLMAIALVLIIAGIVIAVNPSTKPNPGHASNEVMVNIRGVDKTLQAAIDAGDFGGGSLSSIACISWSDGSLLNGTIGYADSNSGNDFLIVCENGKLTRWCHAKDGHGESGYHANESLC